MGRFLVWVWTNFVSVPVARNPMEFSLNRFHETESQTFSLKKKIYMHIIVLDCFAL